MDDNFWSMGVPGPCGPCSEIYYDRGPEYGDEGGPVADEDRYLEVWNLVFMQDIRGESTGAGKGDFPILGPLPQQNIDTGLGVERLAFLLQGVDNVYETDLLRPIIGRMEELSGRRYGDEPHRRRADAGDRRPQPQLDDADRRRRHPRQRGPRLRAAPAAAPDRPVGAAARASRTRSCPCSPTQVRDLMSPSYPEVAADFERIEKVAAAEEQAFLRTIASGSRLFDVAADETRTAGSTVVPGATAFNLHDTQGFPIDLTLEMAAEAGLTVDIDGLSRADAGAEASAPAPTRRPARAGSPTAPCTASCSTAGRRNSPATPSSSPRARSEG